MSFRVVRVSSSSKLDLKMNHLVIRNEQTIKVCISEIAVLIIESTAIAVTSALLCELIKNKVKVIFCDEKRNPISELTPYYGSHDASLKVRLQIKWDNEMKANVWTNIVIQKILKQYEVLKKLNLKEAELLKKYSKEVQLNDETNREGHAAKVYFNALFGKSFTREQENNINSALNYGYSIILSAFNREIVSSGYLTQIGIFHNNMFNQYNLASDLMEPFRPLVDILVYYMNLESFDTEDKKEIIKILNKELYIDGKKQYLLNTIKIYCKSIFEVLNKNPDAQIKVYRNEL